MEKFKMPKRIRLSVAGFVVVAFLGCIDWSTAFNLENRLPIVKFGGRKDAYFGYSVATHTIGEYNWPNNTKCLLVGAPLDKNLQPGTNRTGALYRCPITQEFDDCEQIITDGRRSKDGAYEQPTYDSDDLEELSEPSDDEIKEGQWLGVTVRSQGLGGKVLVCAHRYVTKRRENRYGQGLCYVLTNELKYDEVYEPCKGRTVLRNHEDYGFCQVGTSGALLDDNTMLLGTPGPFTWRGTVFVTEIGGEYLERDKNMYYGDHSDTTSPVDKYSYLGMAVTGGRYFGERMSYAAGAPRSNGHGQVVIFDKASKSPIPVHMIIDGEQFGSSFGYELATADVNGDSKPDLLASAPFYFSKNEGGAVYVYLNDKDTLPRQYNMRLTGAVESRFGLAVANIGDINKDHCEDIAIGAPYEDRGVVYIYLGGQAGLSEKPSQRIAASDLGMMPKAITTFGSSITGGTDLDGNSYADVVVGAYGSNAVVALLARPIISIQTKWQSSELKNIDPTKPGCITDVSTNLTCFTFEACCAIDSYEGSASNKDLKLMYTVEAETFSGQKKFSRVFFDRDNKRSNVIKREVNVMTNGRLTCQRVTGYIKENTRDIQSPLRFRLNYTIVESKLPDSGLKVLNPILDQTQADIEFEGTFQKDCGEDDICESNITMRAELDLQMEDGKYALVLGEQEEIRVNVNVSNSADSAYETQLIIEHQENVSYIAAMKTNTAICNRYNATVVACSLGNPMLRGSSNQISIRFDPSGLDIDETQLTFNVYVNTTSKLIALEKPVKMLTARVVKRVNLSVQGWATPEQSFYSGKDKVENKIMQIEDVGSQLRHTYQIYNDGPWKAPKVILTIHWPLYLVSERSKKDQWLLYLEDLPIIEHAPGGECFVEPQYVNPLNLSLKANPPSIESLLLGPAAYMMRPASMNKNFSRYRYSEKASYTKQDDSETVLNRLPRDTISRIIRPERFMDSRDTKGKKRDIVELDCNKATASCIKIRCEILNLPARTEAYVQVNARLWNSTLVGEHPRVDLVRILSTAQVKIPIQYAVDQSGSADSTLVETRAYPELIDVQRDNSMQLWIIILAIIGGLLVLALFTLAMWKCGFFKRRRPDPTLSGNLEKMNEEKPFLNSKNNTRVF